jgi:hypothetical protein
MYVYFKSRGSDNVHRVAKTFLPKIELLAELISNTIDGTEEFPLEIPISELETGYQESQLEIIGKYVLNTDRQLAAIAKYYEMWENLEDNEDYAKVGPVATSDPGQLLQSKDIRFILDYIDQEVILASKKMHETFLVDYNKYLNMLEYASNVNVAVLGTILGTADRYLRIKNSLTNKLYIYAATIVFDKTLYSVMAFDNQSAEFYHKQKELVAKFYEKYNEKYQNSNKEYLRLTGNPLIEQDDEIAEDDEDDDDFTSEV